jgi:S-(hydroxymethyl)glutathione dehydrogenase / alcohol dehydrogenase
MSELQVRAAVLRTAGQPMQVEMVSIRPPAAGEVRVRIEATGVCHSDLSLALGILDQPTPAVLGHEACGTVIEVGDGVDDLRIGQRVILLYHVPCRHCAFCLRGEAHLCSHGADRGTVPYGRTSDGLDLYPGLGVGSFAEETVVTRPAVIPVPDDIDTDTAALLGCAVITGVGAAVNTAGVQPGSSVIVLGLGGVGLSAVQGARLAGAAVIIAVDRNPDKAQAARRAGAHHFVLADSHAKSRIRTLTSGTGADHVFDCVGSSPTIRQAWSLSRRGGAVCVVGIGGKDDLVELSALELFYFARTIRGCFEGSVDPNRDMPRFFGWVRAGDLDIGSMITGRVGLAQLNEALEAQARGQGIRTLIEPALDPRRQPDG